MTKTASSFVNRATELNKDADIMSAFFLFRSRCFDLARDGIGHQKRYCVWFSSKN